VIVIAIGRWLDKLELAEIASAPYQRNQINVPDYNGLPSIRQKLIDMICDSTCLTTS